MQKAMQAIDAVRVGSGPRARVAETEARAIVRAGSRVRGDHGLHQSPRLGAIAEAGVENDGWRAAARAVEVELPSGFDRHQPLRMYRQGRR